MHRLLSLSWMLAILSGCETNTVFRPIELELLGLSQSAERLRVALVNPDSSPACRGLDADTAANLPSPSQVEWLRGQSPSRTLTLAEVSWDRVRLVAVAFDGAGRAIQLGCDTYAYAELERPEQVVELQMVP